jgi:hypothetical protein
MTYRFDRGGAAFWILMILLAVGSWGGYRVGRLYFDHRTLNNQVEELADRSVLDRSIDPVREIVKLLQGYDVEIDPALIQAEFNLNHDRVTIAFDYMRKADLGPLKPLFSFHVRTEREAAKASGLIQGVKGSLEDSNAAAGRRYQEEVKKTFGSP